jgi:hypothetical protein
VQAKKTAVPEESGEPADLLTGLKAFDYVVLMFPAGQRGLTNGQRGRD